MVKINIVTKGDYEGSSVIFDPKKGLSFLGGSGFKKEAIYLNRETVSRVDLLDVQGKRSNEVYSVAITFQNGRKSYAELNRFFYEKLRLEVDPPVMVSEPASAPMSNTGPQQAKEPKKKRSKGKIILIVVIALFVISAIMPKDSEGEPEKESVSIEEPEKVTVPDFVVTDFDKAVWTAVEAQGATLEAISHENEVYIHFTCDNDEEQVNAILEDISEAVIANSVDTLVCVVAKEDGESSNLVIADISTNGSISITYTSPDYKSERNEWIDYNFNSFDNQCYEFSALIMDQMNNPDSYEFISATRRDIMTESDVEEVNQILANAGSSWTVEIGDFFISETFSGTNVFNAVVKNTAYGIVDYSAETVVLVAVE